MAVWRLSAHEEQGISAEQELLLVLGAMQGAPPGMILQCMHGSAPACMICT